jgi:hypothetical protein
MQLQRHEVLFSTMSNRVQAMRPTGGIGVVGVFDAGEAAQ